MNRGVLLYGAPAVGKDTVTRALEEQGPFSHFRRLKCGPGRTLGYRMIDPETLRSLPAADLLYVNRRYGSTYVVDRPGLDALWASGQVPVIHLGQPEAIPLLSTRTPDARWLVVELHCPLPALRRRIIERGTGDHEARFRAARDTPRLSAPNLSISTRDASPEAVAHLIAECLFTSST